jgi:hypothetical protein
MTAAIEFNGARVDIDPGACPPGKFKYADLSWALGRLPADVAALVKVMSSGFKDPTVTYWCQPLRAGERFGHGGWHKDGAGRPEEVHRLLTLGGPPTEGRGGEVLAPGRVWHFGGSFVHRSTPAPTDCYRLLLRVSECSLTPRNHWT